MGSVELAAAWIFGFYACLLMCDIALYSVVSFALMRSHTESRSFGRSLRAFFHEWRWAVRTAPLLPLYFFIGRRMEPLFTRPANGIPVIFVHGYMQNRVCFLGLARAFARKGIGPLYGFNYPFYLSIPSNAQRLARFIEKVCDETKSPTVDLVCHSMGGLVAMELMRSEERGAALRVRRCVTIASPHAGIVLPLPSIAFGATAMIRGSELITRHAKFSVPVPTLSVFSTHDNLVHPKQTSHLARRGGRDIEVDDLAHMSILFAPVVAEHATTFLLEAGPDAARAVESDVEPLIARAG